MSATPSNARSGWLGLAAPRIVEPREELSRNALQALFAFASLHQQTIDRRSQGDGDDTSGGSGGTPPQDFALDEVLQLVAGRALSITGADGIAIALAHEGAIICRASAGEIAPDRGVKLDPTSGFSGACLRGSETVRCDDSEIDPRVNAAACRALGTRSMVAVPLAAKQNVIGLIEAFSKETYGFNDADIRSLNLLGELILAAIRPEEEDRLAEISRRVIAPESEPRVTPQAPTLDPTSPATAQASPATPKILVDEKFVQLPDAKAEPATLGSKIVFEAHPKVEIPANAEVPTAARIPATSPVMATPPVIAAPATATEDDEPGFATPPPVESAPEVFRFQSLEELAPREMETPEPQPDASRPLAATALVALAVLIVIALGWVGWQKIRHAEQPINADTQPAPEVKTREATPPIDVPSPSSELPNKPVAVPEITAIHNSSSANSSTVVVDLQDQVQYEAHTLSNPDRIYFDLHDTKIAPDLANPDIELTNDPLLKRIRIAQPVDGVTRVVLETKGQAEFTVSLDPNPYRLSIDVHKPGPAAATEIKTTLAPQIKPSPAISTSSGKGTAAATANEFRVVLDAGHGGWDLGTVGKKGLLEKDLVLDIVERLGKLVEDRLGADVIYTRQDDEYLPLEKRAEIANLAKANLFVSVHANYSDLSTARGVETYYTNTYSSIKARTGADDAQLKQVDWTGIDIRAKVTDSHRLAADVQQALYGALAVRNPDIRNRGVKEAQYVVLTGTQMPAVLAEVSFVSSPADEDKLQNSDYRQQIAEALYRGIAQYRGETKHMKLASAKRN